MSAKVTYGDSVYARIAADTAARCIPDGNRQLVRDHGWRGCFRNAEGSE